MKIEKFDKNKVKGTGLINPVSGTEIMREVKEVPISIPPVSVETEPEISIVQSPQISSKVDLSGTDENEFEEKEIKVKINRFPLRSRMMRVRYMENKKKPYTTDEIKKIIKSRRKRVQTSYIEDFEQEEAIDYIRELMGILPPRCPAYFMAVKVHERTDMRAVVDGKKSIILDTSASEDKFTQCSAIVVEQGARCYLSNPQGKYYEPKLDRFLRFFFWYWMKPSGYAPWCKVGDIILIPRNEGPQRNYKGHQIQWVYDENTYCTLASLDDVSRN